MNKEELIKKLVEVIESGCSSARAVAEEAFEDTRNEVKRLLDEAFTEDQAEEAGEVLEEAEQLVDSGGMLFALECFDLDDFHCDDDD